MDTAARRHNQTDFEAGAPLLVCVVASAGGVMALPKILDVLPSDLPIAIVVVQHLAADHVSNLPEILGWHTDMDVRAASHGAAIEPGVIYVAPPAAHLMIAEGNVFELTHTPLVHHVRPAADLLLLSAAERYSGPLIGVILSGTGLDGSAGMQAIHRAGGTVIAQNPDSAAYRGMPAAAIATGDVDVVLNLEDIAAAVVDIVASRIIHEQ